MPITNHLYINPGIGGIITGFNEEFTESCNQALFEPHDYARQVLGRYWPDLPKYDTEESLLSNLKHHSSGGVKQYVISGKYRKESQEIWEKIINIKRPNFFVIESLAILRSRGLVTLLSHFRKIGYDAEWHVISSSAFGATYKGERIWVIAYPKQDGFKEDRKFTKESGSMGKQLITDELFNAFRTKFNWHRPETSGDLPNQPRILRRDEGVSKNVDSTRIELLADEPCPVVSQFIAYCLNQYLNGNLNPRSLFVDNVYNIKISCLDKIQRYNKNRYFLDQRGVKYSTRNGGIHLVITCPAGAIIDCWPSTQTYKVRHTELEGSDFEEIISIYDKA